MLPIKYKASISYTRTDSSPAKRDYVFFATDDKNAKDIAAELFLIDIGVSDDMVISVFPVKVSEDRENRVERQLVKVLYEIDKVASGLSYPEFIKLFTTFEGKNLHLGTVVGFELTFMSFTLRVVMENNKSKVCRDEVLYSCDNNTKYVIRYGNVYYGS